MYNLKPVNQSRHSDTNVRVFDVTTQHNEYQCYVKQYSFLSKGNRNCNIHTVLQWRCLLDVCIYLCISIAQHCTLIWRCRLNVWFSLLIYFTIAKEKTFRGETCFLVTVWLKLLIICVLSGFFQLLCKNGGLQFLLRLYVMYLLLKNVMALYLLLYVRKYYISVKVQATTVLCFVLTYTQTFCLQCFNTVGRAAGRASGL